MFSCKMYAVVFILTIVCLLSPKADGACSYMGDIANGKVVPRGQHPENSVVRYSCDDGYELNGDTYRTCRNNRWTGTASRCQKKNCGDPGTPLRGKRFGTDFTYEKSVVYMCNNGYKLYGRNTRKCRSDGTWDGILPACFRVSCPMPPAVQAGCLTVPSWPVYEDKANYTCNSKFYAVGSTVRTCLFTGEWDAPAPSCKPITCPRLPIPENGHVTIDTLGHTARYTCNLGYELDGPAEMTCDGAGPRGSWSATQPSCKPVSCSDVAQPDKGIRQGSRFVYPSTVTFRCLPGHYLTGSTSMQCQATGTWSADPPTCTACPVNTYKRGSNAERSCTPCPSNSHTATVGSSQVVQCQCNTGFTKQGAECRAIQCQQLASPDHGSIISCGRNVGDVCSFRCDNGYEPSSGDTERRCAPSGGWLGRRLVCSPCPRNMYKGERDEKCQRCPEHTHTLGDASVACVCDSGWRGPPGGPCTDVNECTNQNGGCQQKCENRPGSFSCVCDIPGYKQHPTETSKCVASNQCPTFPLPDEGGAVCSVIPSTNTRRCQVVCNPGYEHGDRVNSFEQCGPSTGWKWTQQGNQVCVEMFFAGIVLESEIYYFVDECEKLTPDQKLRMRDAFLEKMYDNGICIQDIGDLCDITNVEISCGTVWADDDDLNFRRKRSSDGTVLKIKFSLTLPEVSMTNVSCAAYCQGNTTDACKRGCYNSYKKDSLQNINSAFTQLRAVLGKTDSEQRPGADNKTVGFELKVGGVTLKLASQEIKPPTMVRVTCSRGSVPKEGSPEQCYPCPPGTYVSENVCRPCRIGFHQPQFRQLRCRRCPPRSISRRPGSATCEIIRQPRPIHRPSTVGPPY